MPEEISWPPAGRTHWPLTPSRPREGYVVQTELKLYAAWSGVYAVRACPADGTAIGFQGSELADSESNQRHAGCVGCNALSPANPRRFLVEDGAAFASEGHRL